MKVYVYYCENCGEMELFEEVEECPKCGRRVELIDVYEE